MEDRNNAKLRSLDEDLQGDKGRNFGSKKYVSLKTTLDEQVSENDLSGGRATNDVTDSQNTTSPTLSKLASKWESMKNGLTSLRSKRFLPISDVQESSAPASALASQSSGSLDEIFEKLKQQRPEYRDFDDTYDHRVDFRDIALSR